MHGWIPLGARNSVASSVTAYTHPTGSTIAAEDARAIANGLDAELPRIEDEEQPLGNHPFGEDHTESLLLRRAKGERVAEEDVWAARELLSGAPKRDAQELATFLHGGDFAID